MRIFSIFFLLLFPLVFISCSSDSNENSRLNVVLVDSPGEFQEVNIEVLAVSINYGNEGDEGGWQELETDGGIYDLLKLTSGNEKLLVSSDVPGGRISQVRLLLGENNTVKVDDEINDLQTPSGQSSGVKINVQEEFQEGIEYTIILDFDAHQSIVENPQKYILKPVIRASLSATTGAADGTVVPNDVPLVVNLFDENEELVTTTTADENGYFLLRGIDQGTSYEVEIDVDDTSLYEDLRLENIEIINGQVTHLGTLELVEKIE